MGYGDEIMASFVVCELGKKYPHKKIAISAPHSFPNLRPWDLQQRSIYQNNPYLVDPEDVGDIDQERLIYYPDWKCRRDRLPYGKFPSTHKEDVYRYKKLLDYEPEVYRWLMDEHYTNKDGSKGFRAFPGAIFFTEDEQDRIKKLTNAYHEHVLIMPQSPCLEKNWGLDKWANLIKGLDENYKFLHAGKSPILQGVEFYRTQSFRDFLMLVSAVKAVLTTAGGAHHSAAALGTPAMVLFGGNCGRDHMAYDDHLNISIDLKETPCCCRSGSNCAYCIQCWENLHPSVVSEAFSRLINGDNRDIHVRIGN